MTSARIPICDRKEVWSLPAFSTTFPEVCFLVCYAHDAVQIQPAFKSRHATISSRIADNQHLNLDDRRILISSGCTK
jgi:hypothetical protein